MVIVVFSKGAFSERQGEWRNSAKAIICGNFIGATQLEVKLEEDVSHIKRTMDSQNLSTCDAIWFISAYIIETKDFNRISPRFCFTI
ncbi:hypothetical protein Bca4012_065417 [Brassica carinata]|uniref:Uncharacterized protein n=1 Tax=Brassica carinata TaxID=52824 RepID=A0A8X8AWN4_BRACI|nr:hypothetical protein Bca52824_017757 [Brassica carinata]